METRGVANNEIKTLRQQVAKLDPANKSLRIRGFEFSTIDARTVFVEETLRDADVMEICGEHLYKEPSEQRVLSNMCLVEFPTNSIREDTLKKFSG